MHIRRLVSELLRTSVIAFLRVKLSNMCENLTYLRCLNLDFHMSKKISLHKALNAWEVAYLVKRLRNEKKKIATKALSQIVSLLETTSCLTKGRLSPRFGLFHLQLPGNKKAKPLFNELNVYLFKAPSTLIRLQTKTELFCSRYGCRPHYNAKNDHRTRSHSKTLSRVEGFENDAFWKRSFQVWTEKTMLSENSDVIKIDTTGRRTTRPWVSKMADRRYHVA